MRSHKESGDVEGKWSQDTVSWRNHSMWKEGAASKPGGKPGECGIADAEEDDVLIMSGAKKSNEMGTEKGPLVIASGNMETTVNLSRATSVD